jgi:hypothetical protein
MTNCSNIIDLPKNDFGLLAAIGQLLRQFIFRTLARLQLKVHRPKCNKIGKMQAKPGKHADKSKIDSRLVSLLK